MLRMNLGSKFMFATGIENSYPVIQLSDGRLHRVDEMEKCCHYKNWELDFQLTKEQGIEFLRYGPPYYKTHIAPGKYDWDFSDATFNKLKQMDINPIVDLLHFGVPDWMGNFQNPDFPLLFADHAFVQVSRDGSPKIPDSLEKKEEKEITKSTEGSTEGQSPQNSSHGK